MFGAPAAHAPAIRAIPTIMMVHGAGGGGWEYETWTPVFKKRGWRVVARDLVPASKGLARTTFADYVRQIERWPRTRGPLVLVGASMGGPLVLKAAERLHPDAIVLVNPASPSGRPGRKPSPPIVRWANGPLKDSQDAMPDSDEATIRRAWKRWRDESGTVMNALRKGVRVAKPRCPVLMVISGRDTDVPPAGSRVLAARYGADVMTLPNASHVGPLLARNSAEIAARVETWVRRRINAR